MDSTGCWAKGREQDGPQFSSVYLADANERNQAPLRRGPGTLFFSFLLFPFFFCVVFYSSFIHIFFYILLKLFFLKFYFGSLCSIIFSFPFFYRFSYFHYFIYSLFIFPSYLTLVFCFLFFFFFCVFFTIFTNDVYYYTCGVL